MNLVFDAVRFRRGTYTLTADAVFSPGVHLISGRTGTGKSTLALTAAGLLAPDAGEIRYGDHCGAPLLLMQFPEYQVTGTTVTEEIASWNVAGTEEPFALLKVTPSDRDTLTLSRGELRRLELACILARTAELLILDEPYASLDRTAKPILTKLLEERTGITLVFSHETEFTPAAQHWKISDGELRHE